MEVDGSEAVVEVMDCLLRMGEVVRLGARTVLEDMGIVRRLGKGTKELPCIRVVIDKSLSVLNIRIVSITQHDAVSSRNSQAVRMLIISIYMSSGICSLILLVLMRSCNHLPAQHLQ